LLGDFLKLLGLGFAKEMKRERSHESLDTDSIYNGNSPHPTNTLSRPRKGGARGRSLSERNKARREKNMSWVGVGKNQVHKVLWKRFKYQLKRFRCKSMKNLTLKRLRRRVRRGNKEQL
jgi:hypothetical protein